MEIKIVMLINYIVLIFLILLSTGYIVLLLSSIRDVFRRYLEISQGDELALIKSHAILPITAIVPCYNEENSIFDTVQSILNNTYSNKQIIVVNDGSIDSTLQKLIDRYALYKTDIALPSLIATKANLRGYYLSKKHKNLVVIDKTHSDKSDSLNMALNACRTPLFLTIDADTVVEPEALSEIIYYALTKPYFVAVGGAVYISNGCKIEDGKIVVKKMPSNLIAALQVLEYLRSFLFNRAGLNMFGGSLCLSGAFTLFDYESVLAINGFDVGNPANDFEIVTHLHANRLDNNTPYQIGYTPAASAWTDVPTTLKGFWQQRFNWQIGSLRSLLLYKKLLFNPAYGWIGMFVYPLFLFGEVLGCFVELAAYCSIALAWYVDILNIKAAILLFIICWLFVGIISIASMFLSIMTYNKYERLRDIPYLLLLVTIESFGFRQYHMICKIVASIRYLFKGGKI